MRTFIKNILLIFVPSLLLFSYVLIIFISHNLHWFYTRDEPGKNFIIGESYNDEFEAFYKLHKDLDEYKILAIGSSRVLQFSEDMFEEKFFNLGYLAGTVYEIQSLIEHKDIRNKVLIIGIDQWALNPNWPYIKDSAFANGNISNTRALVSRKKIEDIFKGKVYPASGSADDVHLVGSMANLAISGTMPDGSHYYGKIYHGLLTQNKELIGADYEFRDIKDRIKNGKLRFEFGEKADMHALQAIGDLIAMCQKRENKIILFFPPFAPSIVQELNNSKYSYIPDAAAKVSRVCNSFGVSFYDFTNMNTRDSDFVDGFHGGKQVYYNILKQMNFPVRTCIFINPFETVYDSAYTKLRIKFFSGNSE